MENKNFDTKTFDDLLKQIDEKLKDIDNNKKEDVVIQDTDINKVKSSKIIDIDFVCNSIKNRILSYKETISDKFKIIDESNNDIKLLYVEIFYDLSTIDCGITFMDNGLNQVDVGIPLITELDVRDLHLYLYKLYEDQILDVIFDTIKNIITDNINYVKNPIYLSYHDSQKVFDLKNKKWTVI